MSVEGDRRGKAAFAEESGEARTLTAATHFSRPQLERIEAALVAGAAGDALVMTRAVREGTRQRRAVSLADGLSIVSRKWTPEIFDLLRHREVQRFGQIAEALGGASTRTVAERLRNLGDMGLVSRTSYDENPPRVEYRLTGPGRRFAEILQRLNEAMAGGVDVVGRE